MKHLISLLLPVLFTAAGTTAAAAERTTADTLHRRIMTYNVRHGEGMDHRLAPERQAAVINRLMPDAVALQELDSVTSRVKGRDILGELARATQMHATFARAIPYGGGAYGIGILSREKPLAVRRVPLPGRDEARVLLVAEFEEWCLACTHLSLDEDEQIASADIIRQEAARTAKPFILAGDWNAQPDSPTVKRLDTYFVRLNDGCSPTWPADRPTDYIDHIALANNGAAKEADATGKTIDEPLASDHRPLYIDLRLWLNR